MSFFCIVAWEWRVPGGVDGRIWLVECPVHICVNQTSLFIHSPGRIYFSLTQVLHPCTHKLTHWKQWRTTSHPPASQPLPNNLSLLPRDCLCVLQLFTVKWPLVLLMASYQVMILPAWNRQKVIALWYSWRIHSDYPSHTHLEVLAEHYRNIFSFWKQLIFAWIHFQYNGLGNLKLETNLLFFFFSICELIQSSLAIFGTTLWDYTNKKTGWVKGHCQLAPSRAITSQQ